MQKKIGLVCCFLVSILQAQLTHPKASPFTTTQQQVGLTTIKVSYSRPAVRERTIFGDLVPYGRIWRVGANASTKITIDTDVHIMEHILPKGQYALYAVPNINEWEIIFHKNITHWGDGRSAYNPEEDVFRITVVPEHIPYLQENLLISFDTITHDKLDMQWIWEYTKISIPMTVATHAQMQKQITTALADNPTAQTYYEVARYLQEQETEYEKALDYLKKAIALGGDTYYFYRIKSLVHAALGAYDFAVLAAQKSEVLAAKERKDEFVRLNRKNIKKWTIILEKLKE